MQLRTRRNVELVKVGHWPAVTGPADISREKIESMVRAAKDPNLALLSKIKVGHFGKLSKPQEEDGNPLLGRVENLYIKGDSLYGDFVDMPERLDSIIPTAYPSRSIEWYDNYVGPDGTEYPAVLRAVALLGETEPGVDGLAPIEDIEDVYELFAASNSESADYKTAFVGSKGAALLEAFSALSKIIHAQPEETVHDIEAVPSENELSSHYQGDSRMTDTLDSRLREMLNVSADADIEAEIAKLTEKAKASAVETPIETTPTVTDPAPEQPTPVPTPSPEVPTPNPDPEKTVAETKAQPEKAEAKSDVETVTIPAALLADLTNKVNTAYSAILEEKIDKELKEFSAAGRVAPAEIPGLKAQMLSGSVQEETIRQSLAIRPQMFSTTETGSSEDHAAKAFDAEADYKAREAILFGGH